MSVPMLSKFQVNGYELISVNSGPWKVCTKGDRFGSFGTREEAVAYAATLPVYKGRSKTPTTSQ